MANQLFLLLLCIVSLSCSCNNKKCVGSEHQYKTSIDTSKIISEIKRQYAEINAKTASYNKVEKNLFGQSTEGGNSIAYFDKVGLRKIVTTHYGETGKAVIEYYFNQTGLFFALKSEYFYNRPINEENTTIALLEENRYYFYNNILFKWLDKNKKSISPDANEYQQEDKYFIEDIENMKKMFEGYEFK